MKNDKKIIFLIKQTWDSLDSHNEACFKDFNLTPKEKQHCGTKKFHKKCVKEYATMIKTLSELL